jgi:hypothetical protein
VVNLATPAAPTGPSPPSRRSAVQFTTPIIKRSPGRRHLYVRNRALRILPVYSLVLLVPIAPAWSLSVGVVF